MTYADDLIKAVRDTDAGAFQITKEMMTSEERVSPTTIQEHVDKQLAFHINPEGVLVRWGRSHE